MDCYGSPELIGKIGTDILDNKCSWNVNVALKLATPEQLQILEDNYGKKDSESEQRVKDLFNEMGIERLYKEFEEAAYVRINTLIDAIDETRGEDGAPALKKQVFRTFLEKIYGRTK